MLETTVFIKHQSFCGHVQGVGNVRCRTKTSAAEDRLSLPGMESQHARSGGVTTASTTCWLAGAAAIGRY